MVKIVIDIWFNHEFFLKTPILKKLLSNWGRFQQWASGSALKTVRGEVPGSIPGHACRSSDSEFSVVFPETHVNTG